jgi:hypothetical protein
MSAPYFIETIARNGDVLHRHRVDRLPIHIGRSYDNDYIVDDAFAAPHHAAIEADETGELILRDLGTRNGVIHRGKRCPTLALTGDTVFRLGHTSLRVRPASFAVAPEQLDRTRHAWEGALPALTGLLMIAFFALFNLWLSDTQSFQLNRYLQVLAYASGAALVWSGAWAFANRLFGRHARLGRHLFILGCGLLALTVYKCVSSIVGFAFSLEALTLYSSHVAIAIAAGVIYYHLRTVKPYNARRIGSVCIVLALLGSGLSLISNDQRHGRLADDLYMATILPPSLRVSPDHPVDDYMERIGALKGGLDVERTRQVKDNGNDDED